MYKISKSTKLVYEPFGTWSENYGLVDLRTSPINSRRRKNLQGATIVSSLVITHNDSLNHLEDLVWVYINEIRIQALKYEYLYFRDKHIDTVSKAGYVMGNHLLDIVNATKVYTIVPSWGYKDPNATGGWNGMLGQLHRHEADIGL